MNRLIILFVFLFNGVFSSDVFAHFINYNIKYLDSSESFLPLSITLSTQLDENGEFLALFPMGVVEADTDADIESIPKDSGVFLMKGAPNQTFAIRYKVHINNAYQLLQWPVIEKDYIKFTAFTVLVTPNFRLDDEWDIHYSFDNLRDDFKLVSSFSPNEKSLDLKITIAQFRKSIFVGGTQLKHDIIHINEKPVSILYRGTLNRFTQEPSVFFKQLIQTHRDYRKDYDFEHYLIYFEEPECRSVHAGINAEHFYNSIIARFPYCDERFNVGEIPRTFSHELSHAWFGYKMRFDIESGGDLIWFYEGFNDYYGLKLALKSGLMTRNQYLECLNHMIAMYYSSEIKTISNDEISKNQVGENCNVYHWFLAMNRGLFWAYWLDNELSKKGLDLDGFIQKLLFEKTKPSEYFTKEMIYNRFNDYLGDELWNTFRDAIESGKEFDVEKGLKNIAPIVMKERAASDFAFDLKTAVEQNLIKDVRPGSPEQLAGLKDGQKIVIHLVQSKTEKEVAMGVLENDEYKEIKFLPLKKMKSFPEFVIDEKNE